MTNITTIEIITNEPDFFDGVHDIDGIDQDATRARYETEVETALQNAYPGVEVIFTDRGVVTTQILVDGNDEHDERETIHRILSQVWERSDIWIETADEV